MPPSPPDRAPRRLAQPRPARRPALRPHRAILGGLILGLLTGCGAAGPGAVPPPQGDWLSAPGVDHPLTGRVWSSAEGDYLSPAALVAALRPTRYVLLGERHDNADHHRLQAWILDHLLRDGGHAAVAFEMLDDDVSTALATLDHPTPDELARAVSWARSGWPPFVVYAPVFEAVLSAGARVVAAHPDRQTLRGVMTEGIEGWPASRKARLGLDRDLPPGAADALAQEIREAHCGHAPEAMIAPMARAQVVKDAWMAWRLAEAAADGHGGVLVAGAGHTRKDRGVPHHLAVHDPRPAASVAFVEVDPARLGPEDYADLAEIYDYLWFTPRVDDLDPCARFREQLQQMRDAPGPRED